MEKPWESLKANDDSFTHSSFKYVIDHTLIRPRDLILFFKPLSKLKLPIPLNKNDISILLGKYSVEFVKELRNELAAHYFRSPKFTVNIHTALRTSPTSQHLFLKRSDRL